MNKKGNPKVLKVWWSEQFAKTGEKATLNASIENGLSHNLSIQVFEFRPKSKIVKDLAIPITSSEVQAKWRVSYNANVTEHGNPEFRFKASVGKSSRTSKTLYIPSELKIAFTFDDGPSFKGNPTTGKVLKILQKEKIKATFFVEHSRVLDLYGQNILKQMIKEGHEVGIHGVDPIKHHAKHQDTVNFNAKLKDMIELLKKTTGCYPKYIRPPGGWGGWEKGKTLNKTKLRKIYKQYNLTRINGWEAIVGEADFWGCIDKKIQTTAKGDAQKLIILSHDLRSYDVNNLLHIVKNIKGNALKDLVKVDFITISELLKAK